MRWRSKSNKLRFIMIEKFDFPLALECGEVLPCFEVEYTTYGTLSAAKDNVIWVCHALTADSRVAEWWPHTVEEGRFLDPTKWFVVCANFLGSPYGTTSPASINTATGKPWRYDFPLITVRDMVGVHRQLARRLGIEQVELLVGSSIGGFQVMEWAIADPLFAKRIALIATTIRSSAWAIAFNESQRMTMRADSTFGTDSPTAGAAGMAAARSLALLSYRGAAAYNATQTDPERDKLSGHKVITYQQHQGEKLKRRFDAYCYYRLSQTVDTHDIARHRASSQEDLLREIKAKTLVVAITSDILFPPEDHQVMVDNIPNVTYRLIDSPFGHDGFLVEYEQLDSIIKEFMNE